jgi:hypothetical protein
MDWVTIRGTILETIRSCVRITTYWRDKQNLFSHPDDGGATCKLHILGVQGLGKDEVRQERNLTTEKLDLLQTGHRRFTLSVFVESFDQGDDRNALEYTERVRTCFDRSQILELFRSVGLTVMEVGTSQDLTRFEDDHAVSAASIDIMFLYALNSTEGPGLDSIDWIEHVEGETPGTPPDFEEF